MSGDNLGTCQVVDGTLVPVGHSSQVWDNPSYVTQDDQFGQASNHGVQEKQPWSDITKNVGTKEWFSRVREYEKDRRQRKFEEMSRSDKPKSGKGLCWDIFVRLISALFTVCDLYASWSLYEQMQRKQVDPAVRCYLAVEDVWLALAIVSSVLACCQVLQFINDTVIDVGQRRRGDTEVRGICGEHRLKKPFEILILLLEKIPQAAIFVVYGFRCACNVELEINNAEDVLKLITMLSSLTSFLSVFTRSLETDSNIWCGRYCICCPPKPRFEISEGICCRFIQDNENKQFMLYRMCFLCCLCEVNTFPDAPKSGCYRSLCLDKCEEKELCWQCRYCTWSNDGCGEARVPNPAEVFAQHVVRPLYIASIAGAVVGLLNLFSALC